MESEKCIVVVFSTPLPLASGGHSYPPLAGVGGGKIWQKIRCVCSVCTWKICWHFL